MNNKHLRTTTIWIKGVGRKTVQKSHMVVGVPLPGYVVDHIDGDPNNNAPGNLQIITQQQNLQKRRRPRNNTSGVKGVSWHKTKEKWYVQIGVEGKNKHVGSFDSLEEATRARLIAADQYFGRFANDEG